MRKKPVNFRDTMGKEISAMTSLSELDWTQKTKTAPLTLVQFINIQYA
jgi:hypothetical protein